jgi:hypothetical protein
MFIEIDRQHKYAWVGRFLIVWGGELWIGWYCRDHERKIFDWQVWEKE